MTNLDQLSPEDQAALRREYGIGKKPRKPMKRTGFRVGADEITISEAKFQRQVEEAGEKLGWYMWHIRNARQSKAGFPDLLCVRERLVWLELKVYYESGRANRTSGVQDRFHEMLRVAGQEVHVVYNDSDGWDVIRQVLA